MQNDYLITMQTVRSDGEDEDRSEFTTEGSLVKRGSHFYITLDDSGIDGFAQIRTTLKAAPESVTLMRFAPMHTQMLFEPGKFYTSLYQTPFGSMTVGTRTRALAVELTEEGGRVYLDYTIELGDMPTIRNQMTVMVRRK